MRWLIIFWALPLILMGGWYYLAYNDINFGSIYLSRVFHDAVFELYGQILGVSPETIPPLLVKTIAFDTALILSIFAFRRRNQIKAWWAARRGRSNEAASGTGDALPVYPAE